MRPITLSDVTLEDLLPHRDSMMLVEEVLDVNSQSARARFVVKKSWPMADENGVHPLLLIELAAQTAGVCNGWDRILTKGVESDRMGWLVGIKKTDFFVDSLLFGNTIIGRAENTYNFGNLREVSCELCMDGTVIGTTILQLFQE